MVSLSHAVADHLSTRSTRELQAVMRDARTQPLSALINRQQTTIDFEQRRIWRDSFWKGSFARDTLMGREERLVTPIREHDPPYAGGRFWKRFDDIRDGEAVGFVVNYGIRLLPGRSVARQVTYPDDTRQYIKAGDDVLLMTYRNPPYRIVYDLIKVVDDNHCVGVMHLGTFPKGVEFATFVMARNNYPFHKMAVPDHDALFEDPRARAPAAAELAGAWKGYLVLQRHPDLALHNQFNPPLLRCVLGPGQGDTVEARVRIGPMAVRRLVQLDSDRARLTGPGSFANELRLIDADTLVGRSIRPARPGVPVLRYVLTRAERSLAAQS